MMMMMMMTVMKCDGTWQDEVWICMELMATCLEKLMKQLKEPIPECILGKVAVAVCVCVSLVLLTYRYLDVHCMHCCSDEMNETAWSASAMAQGCMLLHYRVEC